MIFKWAYTQKKKMTGYTEFYNEQMIKLLKECVKEIEGGNLDKVDEFNAKNGPVDVKYVRASFNPRREEGIQRFYAANSAICIK